MNHKGASTSLPGLKGRDGWSPISALAERLRKQDKNLLERGGLGGVNLRLRKQEGEDSEVIGVYRKWVEFYE